MAPRSILAQLVVALRDDASGPAKALSGTLKGLEKSAVDFAKTMNGAKWGSAFTKQLGGLKATQDEIAKIKHSWADLQGQLAGAKGRLRTDAQRQWANEWVTRLQAVRVAQQQNTDEGIRNAKRQAVEEKRAAADAAREKTRLAREEARAKERASRLATKAAVEAEREAVRATKAAARERTSEERRAAMESARIARDAARERDKAARDAARSAREAAREGIAAARAADREARRARRDADRADRADGRGARAIGRSVVSNIGYAAGLGSGTYIAGRGVRAGTRAGGEAMREEARDYLAGLSEKDTGRIGAIADEQSAKNKSLTATSLHSLYREPTLEKRGVDVKNESAVSEELNKLFTRTVADLFGKLISQKDQYQNTQRRLAAAPGLRGAESLDQKDPFVALGGVTSQMTNAAAEVSKPIIETILPALGSLSGMLNQLAASIRSNPEFAKTFGDTGTGAATGGILGSAGMALRALWQGKGMNGALAGGLKGGLIGGVGGGLLGYGASKVGGWLSSAAGKVAKVAGGATWQAKTPEAQSDLETQLQGVQERIAGVKSRVHPSRANEPNPEVQRLELEEADLRNRIAAGRDKGSAATPPPAGLGLDYKQAAIAAAEAKSQPRFKVDNNLPEREQGSAASNSLFNAQPFADRAADPRLTKTATPAGLFSPAGVTAPVPAPTVDAAAAANNGQAAGSALGTGVAAGIAAQAPAAEAQGRSLMERIKALFSGGVTVPVNVQQSGGAPAGSSTPAAPARASGGSVSAGSLYRVNEYGEEFFQPSEDGNIIDPRRMGGGGGGAGGGPVSVNMGGINLSISGASDPQAVVEQVVAAINDRVQEAARAAFSDMGVELG